MVAGIIFRKLKSFLLFIATIWKRALCCFRRRRKPSFFVPLTDIDIVINESVKPEENDNWNNWDEQIVIPNTPSSIQEHIDLYRQQAIAARQIQQQQKDELVEVQENFFEDMTPRITRQKKHYVNNKLEESNHSLNRLSLAPDPINVVSQELEEWEENRGWDEQTLDWDTKEALKESRKQARQKKVLEQQQRRQEKNIRPALGARVSS